MVVHYTTWVWVALFLDRPIPVDPYILTVLLFGPAMAVGFRRAPVKLTRDVLAGIAASAAGAVVDRARKSQRRDAAEPPAYDPDDGAVG